MCIRNIVKRLMYFRLLQQKKIKLGSGARIGGFHTQFGGYNVIGSKSFFAGSIGYGSYMGSNCTIYGKIGKFCSIADNVNVVVGNHPTRDYISTHPAFFSAKKQAGFTFVDEQKYEETKYADGHNLVTIENDVWIGYGASILSGVTIHNGAIVAAGSLVTKDVPAYAIVAGIPAKILRYRFSDVQINRLEDLQWWDKPVEWIKKNAEYFDNIDENLDILINHVED